MTSKLTELLIDHFDPKNKAQREDVMNNILPALERERGVLRDLHAQAREAGEDTSEFIANMKALSAMIKTCNEKLNPSESAAA